MKYLLDTCTCISVLRNKTDRVKERFQQSSRSELSICRMVQAELMVRFEMLKDPDEKRKEFLVVNQFCQTLYNHPFDEGVARVYAQIFAHLKNQKPSQLIDKADILIAATALANDLILVTDNTKHFDRIPLLKCENWKDSQHVV